MNGLRSVDAEKARQIANDFEFAVAELNNALDAEQKARQALRDAEAEQKGREAEMIANAALQAQDKQGPLANLATTSKAYTAALDALTWQYSKGAGKPLADAVRLARIDADVAAGNREKAATLFAALKHQALLYAAILNAGQ